MPPAARGLPPSGLLSGGMIPPGPLSASVSRTGLRLHGIRRFCGRRTCFFRMPQRSRRETVFQRKAYRNALPSARPAYKSLRRERDRGEGEGRGKPFSRRVPSPFPRISKCYLHHGALPLSQRELSACASRKVSMHCQKPVWRYMESWPSAARRSSGSFSRSQDSSSER